MANSAMGFHTNLPDELINQIHATAENYELRDSKVYLPVSQRSNQSDLVGKIPDVRSTLNSWIPTTEWIGPYLWYFVEKANRTNFMYDITGFDNEQLQYSVYNEGMFYRWHHDHHLLMSTAPYLKWNSFGHDVEKQLTAEHEKNRKLSLSLQLSDPDEYEGGDLQFVDAGTLMTAPREKGSLVIFDSRVMHRVTKVKSGTRKSLVGWVIGPRWR